MALYIPHSIFHLVRLLYARPETFGPCYVYDLASIQAEYFCCSAITIPVLLEVKILTQSGDSWQVSSFSCFTFV